LIWVIALSESGATSAYKRGKARNMPIFPAFLPARKLQELRYDYLIEMFDIIK